MKARALLVMIAVLVSTAAAAQGGYTNLDLFNLSFNYWPPKPADVKAGRSAKSPIPARIQSLNGKKVRIDGFMIPYDQSSMRVSEFMLVASYDACGFGDMPTGLTDWVDVAMTGGKFATYTTNPIVASGQFEVGEEFDKDGYVTSVYRLAADQVQ